MCTCLCAFVCGLVYVCQWVDAECVSVCSGMFSKGNVGLWLVEACFISLESKAQQMLFFLSACVCVCVGLLGSVFGFFCMFVQLFLLSLSV